MYNLSKNRKLGYYQVGNSQHYSKTTALVEATKTNQFPEWNFNRDVFDRVNWLVEPQTSISDLYRLRALQLREQYDYIRLEFSGGADSATTLYSFVLNQIHLDEVVFRYPKTGEKNATTSDPFNTKSENTLSEWEFAAKPILQWLASHHPQTKITVHDYSEDMVNTALDDTWVFRTKDYCNPAHAFKHDNISFIDHRRTIDSGKSICVLYGVDKPKMCIRDKKWYLYFIDFQANTANSVVNEYTNINIEYFFWTPDLPEIVQKQAHIIRNWFMLPENKFLQHLVRWPNHSVTQRTTYEHVVKPLIYPDYDPATFQVSKPSNNFYSEMDFWFYQNFQGTNAYKNWQAGIQLVTDNIDLKYFNTEQGRPVGFVGFVSPFYYIGTADYESSGINEFSKF
jgi:hypothetical protein